MIKMAFRKMNRRRFNRKRKNPRRAHKQRNMFGRATKIRTMTVRGVPSGIPDRMRIKVNFSDVRQAENYNANNSSSTFYALNDAWDPALTGGTQEAASLKQWSAFYDKYRVNASKISVTCVPKYAYAVSPTGFISATGPSGTAQFDASARTHFISLKPFFDGTGTVGGNSNNFSITNELVDPYTRYGYLGLAQGKGKLFLKNYMTVKKISGYKSLAMDDGLTSTTVASPTSKATWYINVTEIDDSVTSTLECPVIYLVKATYYIELFNRKNLFNETQ